MPERSVPEPGSDEVKQLLVAIGVADTAAAVELLPLVQEELRRLGRARLEGEPAGEMPSTRVLVEEAYKRIAGDARKSRLSEKGQFVGAAALAMRRIMVERARHRAKVQKSAGRGRVNLDATVGGEDGPGLLALDAILNTLEARDPRRYQVVLLRYFGGLSVEETAAAMGVLPAAVTREWTIARAWLQSELAKGEHAPGTP